MFVSPGEVEKSDKAKTHQHQDIEIRLGSLDCDLIFIAAPIRKSSEPHDLAGEYSTFIDPYSIIKREGERYRLSRRQPSGSAPSFKSVPLRTD